MLLVKELEVTAEAIYLAVSLKYSDEQGGPYYIPERWGFILLLCHGVRLTVYKPALMNRQNRVTGALVITMVDQLMQKNGCLAHNTKKNFL